NGTSPGPNDVLDVDLYPTATTFEILERWVEENRINLNSFNPEDEIQLLDWYEINELWIINSDDIKSNLSDYITECTVEKGKTVESFAKNTDYIYTLTKGDVSFKHSWKLKEELFFEKNKYAHTPVHSSFWM